MACVSQAMISANTCTFTSPRLFKKCLSLNRQNFKIFTIRASSDDPDCNDEDCAPDKEPAIYVAESAISSGTAASLILIQVGKTPTVTQAVEYSGPALSYYINKFKPPEIVQAAVPSQGESSPSVQLENSASEVPQIQVQSQFRPAPSTSSENSIS
ncbi:hypothetical protein GH714_036707 [Hevea brasiliensis]|uniref:Uncharacterized protein n=1 Tax=Hevea brasiliensis TaxID=3981 RepID=A0A6A6NF01_HEVBR|nr:hypothetical protein GH714_036707 [Hevea brasiliensis]